LPDLKCTPSASSKDVNRAWWFLGSNPISFAGAYPAVLAPSIDR
jgi:hypothetical protein